MKCHCKVFVYLMLDFLCYVSQKGEVLVWSTSVVGTEDNYQEVKGHNLSKKMSDKLKIISSA